MPIDLTQTVAVVAGAIAGIATIWAVALRSRLRATEDERLRIEAVAVKGREILDASPDGLFLWDHALGGITCSKRLAVLLNLEKGTNASYDDIRVCFEGDSLKSLERGISALRANGTPFDLVLTAGERTIHAISARAETDDHRPLADMVWMRDITDNIAGGKDRAAAARINASGLNDRHLTALLDAMPMPVWLRDSKLALAFTNRDAAGIVEGRADIADRARRDGAAVTERRLLDDAGRARLMDVTEVPLGNLGGDTGNGRGGTLGFAIDRFNQDEIAGAAQRQQAAAHAVLEELPTAVVIFDSERALNFFNAAYCELWGLDADWLRTRPSFGEVLERLREARRLPEVTNFREFKARQIAHFTILTEAADEILHTPDGRTIRMVTAPHGDSGLVVTYEDTSEKLNLERSVNALNAVQRETLDNLHEGVAVFGSDGRLKLFNPVFQRLWGFDGVDLEGEPHLSDVLEHTRSLIQPPVESDEWEVNTWRVHKDLVVAHLLSRITSSGQLEFTNGTIVEYANVPLPDGAILLSYMDVTASAQVEYALRQRAEALKEADRLKSEFIANVSHQIRTPLNTVIGFADMLGQDYFGGLNPRQAEYVHGILDTSRGLMAVISDILDLATIEAKRMELERDTVDIHALLVAALNLNQERARRKDLKVKFDCPSNIGWITADEKRLKQVVFHLLSNAITFTPPRGTVGLEGWRESDDIVIAVADTGVGIPQTDRERLFRPFEKGAGGEGAGGTASGKDDSGATGPGLGLTLVRNFVELHGGTVEVKSAAGRGTTVTCRLPIQRTDA